MTLHFSRPGKPTDNAYIEAFNGRFRAECLNAHWFLTLADATEGLAQILQRGAPACGDRAQGPDLVASSQWRRQPAIVRKPGNSTLKGFLGASGAGMYSAFECGSFMSLALM